MLCHFAWSFVNKLLADDTKKGSFGGKGLISFRDKDFEILKSLKLIQKSFTNVLRYSDRNITLVFTNTSLLAIS